MQRVRFWLLCLAFASLLSACADKPEKPVEDAAPAFVLEPLDFADLPGWQDGAQGETWVALRRSCDKLMGLPDDTAVGTDHVPLKAADWKPACEHLSEKDDLTAAQARAYMEAWFAPFAVRDGEDDEGLFTGYYEAELHGSRQKTADFQYPIYARPDDLVTIDLGRFSKDLRNRSLVGQVRDGKVVPYPERGALEGGLLDKRDLELLWIDDAVDVFSLQVQGSGRVVLPDGEVVRVGFSGHNGRPYKSIGRHLIDEGELKPHEASWDGIRGWLEENPDKVRTLFAENPRFVFFRILEGPGPIGSQGVALTPGRSLAVDRSYIPMGMPIWLDTVWPSEHDKPLRRLMVAQDTGGAINGAVRGDFFWGYGEAALAKAGRMKSPGRYFLLLPKSIADQDIAKTG